MPRETLNGFNRKRENKRDYNRVKVNDIKTVLENIV